MCGISMRPASSAFCPEAVRHVEAIESRTLSAKLWPREGLLDNSFPRPVDAELSERTLDGLQDRR